MKKLYLLLAAVAVAATSCQKDVVENIPCNDPMTEEPCSPYAVSKEEALDKLYNELALIDGAATRANDRRVRKIEPVRYDKLAPATRSTVADVEDLLYIVEFEDGKGSAILGADKRVEGVFAVLDEGVITAEDFDNAATGVATDELNTYLAGLIADEAIEQMSHDIIDPILPPDPEELRVTYIVRDTIADYYEYPRLRTHWSQKGIYNDKCLDDMDEECNAGPLTIAIAQFLMSIYGPDAQYITIGGETFDRYKLITEDPNEVASYVYRVGVTLGNDYLHEDYNESFESAIQLLTNYGFTSVYDDNIVTIGDIVEYVYNQKRPVIMQGTNTHRNNDVHYWLIDGISHLSYRTYFYTYEGNKLVDVEYMGQVSNSKVHANFGMAGKSNGFYSWSIFDVSQPLDDEDVITEIGDSPNAIGGNKNYSTDLHILQYSI